MLAGRRNRSRREREGLGEAGKKEALAELLAEAIAEALAGDREIKWSRRREVVVRLAGRKGDGRVVLETRVEDRTI